MRISCEAGNKTLGCINCAKFFDWARSKLGCHKELCCFLLIGLLIGWLVGMFVIMLQVVDIYPGR